MFDHVEYRVSNINAARSIYSPICAAIGTQEVFFDVGAKELGYGTPDIVHMLLTEGAATKPKMHICFAATSKDAVSAAYEGAIAGGATCNGKPGYRDHYAPGYFAAFIHDADGHNIEILFRDPNPQTRG